MQLPQEKNVNEEERKAQEEAQESSNICWLVEKSDSWEGSHSEQACRVFWKRCISSKPELKNLTAHN
jgi:hypothetical protein